MKKQTLLTSIISLILFAVLMITNAETAVLGHNLRSSPWQVNPGADGAVFLPLVMRDGETETKTTSQITQFGITWTFDQPYPFGQFANGDYWVVGPVNIIAIDPPCQTVNDTVDEENVERVINGAMLDPRFPLEWPMYHGYDSAARYYTDDLNVAKDISTSTPLHIDPNHSLVSTDSNYPLGTNKRRLRTAAVLTVLAELAPTGSFRPSYASVDKTPIHTIAQLDYTTLLTLTRPSKAPDLADVEKLVERPWIDHYSVDMTLESHIAPVENMDDYGRDICTDVGSISMMLNLDFSNAEKEKLLISFVQVGIDLYGVATTGGGATAWHGWGGHRTCRKWPILFAGILLHDDAMKNVQAVFAEDELTYYYDDPNLPTDAQGRYSWTGSEVLYKFNYHWSDPEYQQIYEHKSPDEWTKDDDPVPYITDDLCEDYRLCCTAKAWGGVALAARLMGAMDIWNNPSFFDYVDRWMYEDMTNFLPIMNAATGGDREPRVYRLTSLPFVKQLWDSYRNINDTSPPTVPQDLVITVRTGGERELNWARSGDNLGGVGYYIYRDSEQIATVYEPTFLDTESISGPAPNYQVAAFDWTGNTSALSDPVSLSSLTWNNHETAAGHR